MKASNVTATKKLGKVMPDLEEAIEEDDDADVVEPVEVEEDELDLKGDKYIKQPKAKAKRAPKKGAKANADDDEDEEEEGAKTKAAKGGKGKKAPAKGKGKK
jgi:replication factor C subunit 1